MTRQLAIDRTGPEIVAEADRPAGEDGWYNAPVTVTFRCADAVSGVSSCPSPVTVDADGAGQRISRSATDRAGNTGTTSISISIDRTPPTITGKLSPGPDHGAWYWNAPTISWTCADALSGVSSCPESETASEGVGQTVARTARDRAGNRADGSVGPFNVDLRDGHVAIATSDGAVLLRGQTLKGTADDTATGSGIARVVVTYTPTLAGTATVVEARLTCGANKVCTWEADLPPTGVNYRVTARATEVSGRSFPAEKSIALAVS